MLQGWTHHQKKNKKNKDQSAKLVQIMLIDGDYLCGMAHKFQLQI